MRIKITRAYKLYGFFLFFFLSAFLKLQSQNCIWANSCNGAERDYGIANCHDAAGNLFATGYFTSSTLLLGNITLTRTGTFGGAEEFYLVKYDPQGNVLWARTCDAGTSAYGTTNGNAVSVDSNGNAILVGSFASSTLVIGNYTLTQQSGNGNDDIFIVKYDAQGNVLWARSEGGKSGENVSWIQTDQNNNFYITGVFLSDTLTIGATTLTNHPIPNQMDIFIAKYDASGNPLWAKSYGGNTRDEIGRVCLDALGNIFFEGAYLSDTIAFENVTLTNAGNYDFFVGKLDPAGNLSWCKKYGGLLDDFGGGISTDISGNLYMTGTYYSSAITIGNFTFVNDRTHGDVNDAFLIKFDTNGNVIWVNTITGPFSETGSDVFTDALGNVVVAGYFSSDTAMVSGQALVNTGLYTTTPDIFIAVYNSQGVKLSATKAGGPGYDFVMDIDGDSNGNLWMTGYFFGPTCTIGTITLTNNPTFPNAAEILTARFGGVTMNVRENNDEQEMSLFPNPIKNQSLLQTNHPLNHVTVEIFNALGQLVKKMNDISGTSVIIDRNDLSAGVYFMHLVENSSSLFTKRMIITD